MSIISMLIAVIGLTIVVACGYWVLTGAVYGGSFRVQTQNLKTCPQCGTPLDSQLDHCPKCSLRTSV